MEIWLKGDSIKYKEMDFEWSSWDEIEEFFSSDCKESEQICTVETVETRKTTGQIFLVQPN